MYAYSRTRLTAQEAQSTQVFVYDSKGKGQDRMRTLAAQHWGLALPVPAYIEKCAERVKQARLESMQFQDVTSEWRLAEPVKRQLRKSFRTLAGQLGVPGGQVSKGTLNWLLADEVVFHIDESLADDAAFLIWHVGGPAKAVEFPWLGCGVCMEPGDALLFDGMHAHGVRRPLRKGKKFARSSAWTDANAKAEDVTVFASLDLPLTLELEKLMGITSQLSDAEGTSFSVDEQTGRWLSP